MFRLFRSALAPALGLSLALSLPVEAQNTAQPAPSVAPKTPVPAPKQVVPTPPVNTSNAPNPILLPLAILGCLTGLAGLGLGLSMLTKNRELEKQVRDVSNWKNAAVEQIKEARGSIKEENVERYIFSLLRQSNSFKENEHPGTNLRSALEGIGDESFALAFRNNIKPTLNQLTDSVDQHSGQLGETIQKIIQTEDLALQLRGAYQNLHSASEETKKQVSDLKIQTRDELDTFVYNIYSLLFAQSQGDPTAHQLQDQLTRYGRLFEQLQAVPGDSLTQGTLQQFAEVTEKLRFRLEKAHRELPFESAAPEKMPYLDESRKGEALQILDGYRRQVRGETAQAQALTKELSGAVLDFQRPLQTLLAGATFLDVDNPARNRSHEQLLAQIKAIFAEAGVEIYHPQKGETLDITRAAHEFADGERHPAPFVIESVEKLGLTVDGVTEKGEVLVA